MLCMGMKRRHLFVTIKNLGNGKENGMENVQNLQTETMTRAISLDPANCPVRQVMDGLGDKWSILVMTALSMSQRRFSELRRDIPDVSQKMLTHTLRKLERDGLIERIVTPSAPPRVDYRLRPLGQSLFNHLAHLAKWVIENRSEIDTSRTNFDARAA